MLVTRVSVYIQVYLHIYIHIYVQVAYNFDNFYVTKLKFGMIFTKTKTLDQGRVVPGACPWMGPGVRMYNRSYWTHAKWQQ